MARVFRPNLSGPRAEKHAEETTEWMNIPFLSTWAIWGHPACRPALHLSALPVSKTLEPRRAAGTEIPSDQGLGYGEFKTEGLARVDQRKPRYHAIRRLNAFLKHRQRPHQSPRSPYSVGTPPAPPRFLNAGPHPSRCTHHPCSGGIGPARGRSFGDPAKCFDQVSLQARKNLTENQKVRIRPG
ncbi:MAG: hypothetical protein CM15mP25_0450 [Gammaproteobacteria bacterium]|nr:MAG: hypothetical protein CM15mP25_0450 [Gammaproteobacteria bacterium]